MDTKRCYIAGAGDFCETTLPEAGDYIIAADAGYTALTSRGITPDVVIGDFDSLGEVPNHPNVVQSSAEKDDTDMMLAIKFGLLLGYTHFILNGGLGGRLDHTYSNIQTLAYLTEHGATGVLYSDDTCVTAIENGIYNFTAEEAARGNKIAVFSHNTTAKGVTLKGLKYSLENATLTNDNPIGTSNEFTGSAASVEVKNGIVVIIWGKL
ncbi:MAG: thiamine diphosphokinase [Oscillospiraceae bacterium]|nr:thiamine diphosphokinase [Oscillospiraceae bacterium]